MTAGIATVATQAAAAASATNRRRDEASTRGSGTRARAASNATTGASGMR